MKESTKKVIIAIVIIAVLIFIGLMIFKKKGGPKSFKSRMDELDDCHDVCFEKYPFQWQAEKRQVCMTNCLSSNTNTKTNSWVEDYNTCVDKKCGSPEKCHNECDKSHIPPKKPERSQFASGKEFSAAMGMYPNLYNIYLAEFQKCHMSCDSGDMGTCRKQCCIESKQCDNINDEPDRMKCIQSCDMVSKQM